MSTLADFDSTAADADDIDDEPMTWDAPSPVNWPQIVELQQRQIDILVAELARANAIIAEVIAKIDLVQQ